MLILKVTTFLHNSPGSHAKPPWSSLLVNWLLNLLWQEALWSSPWSVTLRHIRLQQTHIFRFGLACQHLLRTFACVIWPLHSWAGEDGSHFHCNQCILPSADIAFILHLTLLSLDYFLPLLHSYQKGLLLLLSVSDSTSLPLLRFLIHHIHACGLAASH